MNDQETANAPRTGFALLMHRAFADPQQKLYMHISNFVAVIIFISIGMIVYETVLESNVITAKSETETRITDIRENMREIIDEIRGQRSDGKYEKVFKSVLTDAEKSSDAEDEKYKNFRKFYAYWSQQTLEQTLANEKISAKSRVVDLIKRVEESEDDRFLRKVRYVSSDGLFADLYDEGDSALSEFRKFSIYFTELAQNDTATPQHEEYITEFADVESAFDSIQKRLGHITFFWETSQRFDRFELEYKILEYTEIFTLIIFLLEYFGNIYVTRPIRKYVLGGWGLVDFFAIAPSLIKFINISGLKIVRVMRILRFLRLMRLLKLAKVVADSASVDDDQDKSTLKMDLQIYFITMFSVLTMASTLMFYAESKAQPEDFRHIPDAMWWGIVTMTTVGYGDVSPITPAGKIIAAATGLCGLALFGLLMNIVGNAMMEGLFGGGDDEESGITTVLTQSSAPERIEKLADLKERGLISEEEFQEKRQKLLDQV